MGALGLSTTRAKTSTSCRAALARRSARVQASTLAPSGQHLFDQNHPAARRFPPAGPADTLNATCPCWPARTRQPDLLLGRSHLLQQIARKLDAALPADRPGRLAGLVEAVVPGAPPVQRRSEPVGALGHSRPARAIRQSWRARDRCGPAISAHAPACAQVRHSLPPARGRRDARSQDACLRAGRRDFGF